MRNPSPITEGIISSLWFFITSFHYICTLAGYKAQLPPSPWSSKTLRPYSQASCARSIHFYAVCPGRFALHALWFKKRPGPLHHPSPPNLMEPSHSGFTGSSLASWRTHFTTPALAAKATIQRPLQGPFFPNVVHAAPFNTATHIKTSHRHKCPPNSGKPVC